MVPQFGQYPPARRTILHLSDTHLLAGDVPLGGRYDTAANLKRTLHAVEALQIRPDAIVFTGDLADRGQPDAYARLRALVDPAAERMGARVIWVMGNHDDRASFRQGLRDELGDVSPIDDVYWLGGLRVIVLDSTVPGHHYGDVSESQLDWLAAELATAAPEGTVLAMHHPPIPSVLDLAVSVELRDQSQLREVLEGSDVRSILAGHLHYSSTATFAGIPVSVASASCYTQDLNVPVGGTRGRDGARSFNLVHVYPNTVLHSVVPLGHYPTLAYVDAEESARRLAADGIRIPPAPRRELPTEPISILA